MPNGLLWGGQIPFEVGPRVATATAREPRLWQIPVGAAVTALHFLHATSRPERVVDHLYDQQGVLPRQVGRVTVYYADGSTTAMPLIYRQNITDWNSKLGIGEGDLVWQGRRGDGALVTACATEWRNPSPEKPVLAVDVERLGDAVDLYVLAATAQLAR
jgi:hypothetical protein